MPRLVAGQQYQIVDGPSKFDLAIALFDGVCGASQKELLFQVSDDRGFHLKIQLLMVQRSGMDDEAFMLRGFFRQPGDTGMPQDVCDGYYLTRTRKGWIQLDANYRK